MTPQPQVDTEKLVAFELILRLERERAAALFTARVDELRANVTLEQNVELERERNTLLAENKALRTDLENTRDGLELENSKLRVELKDHVAFIEHQGEAWRKEFDRVSRELSTATAASVAHSRVAFADAARIRELLQENADLRTAKRKAKR